MPLRMSFLNAECDVKKFDTISVWKILAEELGQCLFQFSREQAGNG